MKSEEKSTRVFILQKYGKFWSISLDTSLLFVKGVILVIGRVSAIQVFGFLEVKQGISSFCLNKVKRAKSAAELW